MSKFAGRTKMRGNAASEQRVGLRRQRATAQGIFFYFYFFVSSISLGMCFLFFSSPIRFISKWRLVEKLVVNNYWKKYAYDGNFVGVFNCSWRGHNFPYILKIKALDQNYFYCNNASILKENHITVRGHAM